MINAILNRIRLTRLEKNFSQEYLASKIGMSQSYYARIESGKNPLTINYLLKIAEILEISPKKLFDKKKART